MKPAKTPAPTGTRAKPTAATKAPRLRWKRDPREQGLRSIIASPPGHSYHDGEKVYATVSALGGRGNGELRGWYWVAGWDSDVPGKNTCNEPCPSVEEAKAQAEAYVKKHLEDPKEP